MTSETYHRKDGEATSLEIRTIPDQQAAIVIEGGVIVGELRFWDRANLLTFQTAVEGCPLFANGPAPVRRAEKRKARPLGRAVDVVLGIGEAMTKNGREMQFGEGSR